MFCINYISIKNGFQDSHLYALYLICLFIIRLLTTYQTSFPGGSDGKESAFKAGDVGDTGSVPGSGRSLEKEMETRCSVLAWRIPWTEEPGGYSPWGHKESDTTDLVWYSIAHMVPSGLK